MSLISIDLPDEILAEVSRLAQEFNVPRAEIFRRAVGALANERGLIGDLKHLQEMTVEAETARRDLASRLETERARAEEKTRELVELKARTADVDTDSRRAQEGIDQIRLELSEKEKEREKLAVRLAASQCRVEKLGGVLAERTYLAIRSLEVERLRQRLEKLIARVLEAENRGRASEGAATRMAGRAARLSARLRAAEAKMAELVGQYADQKEATNKRERDIGQLRRELEGARRELKTVIKLMGGKSASAKP